VLSAVEIDATHGKFNTVFAPAAIGKFNGVTRAPPLIVTSIWVEFEFSRSTPNENIDLSRSAFGSDTA